MFARYLDEPGIPEVDLFVRSSGEQRLSNFLLWQSAYAELVFLDTLWPTLTAGTCGTPARSMPARIAGTVAPSRIPFRPAEPASF